ncbi:hypothetical protein EYZ11_004658 [Aspergillus tanneri]|uniref:Uncharacterized protein n=1 Tax=Aspergillus tanneri TaxID=1220188 RepID=A0A4S3JKK9_9EURO|nr:uncharacterized protein ATNIH1004_011587 [Aspergillus tanneri]KAA8642642.1 hypothetical protein ATNIH1004_011587 [Aspergillus tanneri]THC95880.1 hypothetical protein EYZ11_004658 [Aspergillus tanneri]
MGPQSETSMNNKSIVLEEYQKQLDLLYKRLDSLIKEAKHAHRKTATIALDGATDKGRT